VNERPEWRGLFNWVLRCVQSVEQAGAALCVCVLQHLLLSVARRFGLVLGQAGLSMPCFRSLFSRDFTSSGLKGRWAM